MAILYDADQIAVAKQIHDFFKSRGYSEIHCAALNGNSTGEDSLVPSLRGDRKEAFNLWQWHWKPRGLYAFQHTGIDVRTADLDDTLKLMLWELEDQSFQAPIINTQPRIKYHSRLKAAFSMDRLHEK